MTYEPVKLENNWWNNLPSSETVQPSSHKNTPHTPCVQLSVQPTAQVMTNSWFFNELPSCEVVLCLFGGTVLVFAWTFSDMFSCVFMCWLLLSQWFTSLLDFLVEVMIFCIIPGSLGNAPMLVFNTLSIMFLWFFVFIQKFLQFLAN